VLLYSSPFVPPPLFVWHIDFWTRNSCAISSQHTSWHLVILIWFTEKLCNILWSGTLSYMWAFPVLIDWLIHCQHCSDPRGKYFPTFHELVLSETCGSNPDKRLCLGRMYPTDFQRKNCASCLLYYSLAPSFLLVWWIDWRDYV